MNRIFSPQLHEALVWLKGQVERGEVSPCCGICYGVSIRTYYVNELEVLFEEWPKFSGNPDYPVPSTDPKLNAEEMFELADNKRVMWTGEYGALRKELLDYLIERTKP